MKRKFTAVTSTKVILGLIALLVTVSAVAGLYLWSQSTSQVDNSSGEGNTTQSESTTTVDRRDLEVQVVKPERTVYNSFTEVSVISNKQIEFNQNNRFTTKFIGNEDGLNYYVVTVRNIPTMGVEFDLTITDEVGNSVEQIISVERESFSFPAGYDSVYAWPDSEYILDADKLDVEVTKQRRLLEDYQPDNVLNLNEEFGILTLNNASLKADAARALDSMLRDLRSETNVTDVTVVSGYRSFNTQLQTYARFVRSLGEKRANEISARPGHSEHQLGTAVDLSTVSLGYSLTEDFANTTAGRWLAENATNYGFRQFQDEDYAPEPWQFRYYGVDNQ